jgi:cytoskeletal protein RodZ
MADREPIQQVGKEKPKTMMSWGQEIPLPDELEPAPEPEPEPEQEQEPVNDVPEPNPDEAESEPISKEEPAPKPVPDQPKLVEPDSTKSFEVALPTDNPAPQPSAEPVKAEQAPPPLAEKEEENPDADEVAPKTGEMPSTLEPELVAPNGLAALPDASEEAKDEVLSSGEPHLAQRRITHFDNSILVRVALNDGEYHLPPAPASVCSTSFVTRERQLQ